MARNILPEGIKTTVVYHNLSYDEIFNHEKDSRETALSDQGAMVVDTGIFTGRSPNDKYFVNEEVAQKNLWVNENGGRDGDSPNFLVEEEAFNVLHKKACSYLSGRHLYVFEGFAGARLETRIKVRVVSEKASQHHFVTNMFIRPEPSELVDFEPDFTIINAAGIAMTQEEVKKFNLHSEVAVIFHLGKKMAVIGGTWYGGEMKKGVFSIMNFYRPLEGILTMHCSANESREGNSALFFGLSGTGKTTLSTDPKRPLLGDDEHGWDDQGIWNIEGGCYAKTIDLDPEKEPAVYKAIKKNALVENVVMVNGVIQYENRLKTENTRVSYPIEHIENRINGGVSKGHPDNIIFLTADAFGVLPPVSRLTPEQASYHFLSGYTAVLAGTERGVNEPKPMFSTCFGKPFMTLHPTVYANLLQKKMAKHKSKAWLVSTGWQGGAAGAGGKRMDIRLTRSILDGIFSGELEKVQYETDNILNLEIPTKLGIYDSSVLNTRNTWSDKNAYDAQREKLAGLFIKNADKYTDFDPKFKNYGPQLGAGVRAK